MNKLIEKIKSRIEEYAFDMSLENPDCKAIWVDRMNTILDEEAKAYNESLLNELVEAKQCCGENSDCSQCIFGQIEDRCVLADLQNDRTVKTNADRIRSMTDEELAEMFTKLAWNSEVQTTPLKYLDWLKAERGDSLE